MLDSIYADVHWQCDATAAESYFQVTGLTYVRPLANSHQWTLQSGLSIHWVWCGLSCCGKSVQGHSTVFPLSGDSTIKENRPVPHKPDIYLGACWDKKLYIDSQFVSRCPLFVMQLVKASLDLRLPIFANFSLSNIIDRRKMTGGSSEFSMCHSQGMLVFTIAIISQSSPLGPSCRRETRFTSV